MPLLTSPDVKTHETQNFDARSLQHENRDVASKKKISIPQNLLRIRFQRCESFFWDMVSRYGHLTCASDKPVPEQPGPARDSLSSLCLTTRAAATWHQALPNSLNPLKSHFCAEKGKKAHEGGTGGGWYCGPAEILGEKRDWPLYQTWLQLVIRRKESFFVQLTHSEPWVGPVYRQGPVSDDTLMLGEERQEAPHKSSLMNCARPGPGSPLPGPAICWQIWAN